MENRNFGYLDTPANGLGILRARTLLGNLRLWDIPRSIKALELIISELGNTQIPGIYLLFDESSGKKVYIGQSENIKNRLMNHINTPENKIKNWKRAIIINDARNAIQSDFNDENIRLILENYLVSLFKINRYSVETASSRNPSLSSTQLTQVNSFKEEINVLLFRNGKITKFLTGKSDDEIFIDELKKILEKKNYILSNWGKLEANINGVQAFIRPGSLKPKGWQVTFRGHKKGSLKNHLQEGEGYLVMPRGQVLLIPLCFIKDRILSEDNKAFERDTVDIFIEFTDEAIFLIYKKSKTDISQYTILTNPNKVS